LTVVRPAAFGRSTRVRRLVEQIVAKLNLKDQWTFELAALLSQIGCIALPIEILEKSCAGAELSPDEHELFASHPSVGAKLIRDIPRLELVAEMVARQLRPYLPEEQTTSDGQVEIGAQLLSVTLDFDLWLSQGLTGTLGLERLRERRTHYNPAVVEALAEVVGCGRRLSRKSARVRDLVVGMIAEEDIRSREGQLLFAKGMEISAPVLECLRRFAAGGRVCEPILVLQIDESVPQASA